MPDTSNEIIQTLEAIHNDIKAAKDTLKSNNVALDSNATSTLSAEINKIPASIKSADKLIGFNNGKSSLENGFIYPVEENECNNSNTVVIECDEYIFPENKTINMSFPPTNLIDNFINKSPKKEFKVFAKGLNPSSNLYQTVLKPMYKAYIDSLNSSSRVYKVDIVLDGDFYTGDSHVFNEFVFPNLYIDFYARSSSSETETPITSFNINKFHFSLPYKGNNITINCNELVIEFDTLLKIINTVDHSYGIYYDNDEFYQRRDNTDSFIINLPDFNVSYSNFATNFTSFAEKIYGDNASYLPPNNIQIRINETSNNLDKLNEDEHKVNILRFLKIYNSDGTKVYDPNNKEFVDKDTYILESNLNNTMTSKAKFFEDHKLGFYETQSSSDLIDYKGYIANKNKERSAALNALTLRTGYAYYNQGIGGITQANQFRFDDYNQPAVFDRFPMFNIAEGVLRINRNSTPSDSGNIIGNAKLKFECSDILIDSTSNILPAITMCLGPDAGGGFTYNGIEFKNTGTDNTEIDGSITYHRLSNFSNLLFSPFDAEFKTSNDTLITDIVTNTAPLVYNKNIKHVKIKSEANSSGKLQSLIGYGVAYQTADSYSKPEVPSEPMKIILDNDATIVVSQSPTYYAQVREYTHILGPYSTDELAKHFDKFIHVCIDENHPKLGTFEFCKFRLPLYNLDNTKKYNYSKKVWEPVTALTDDSATIETIYPTESAAEYTTVAENPGYELP